MRGLEARPHQREEVRIEEGAGRARRQGVEPNSRCSRWIARDAQERGLKLDGRILRRRHGAGDSDGLAGQLVVVSGLPATTRDSAPTHSAGSSFTRDAAGADVDAAAAIARSAISCEPVDVPLTARRATSD